MTEAEQRVIDAAVAWGREMPSYRYPVETALGIALTALDAQGPAPPKAFDQEVDEMLAGLVRAQKETMVEALDVQGAGASTREGEGSEPSVVIPSAAAFPSPAPPSTPAAPGPEFAFTAAEVLLKEALEVLEAVRAGAGFGAGAAEPGSFLVRLRAHLEGSQ